MARKREYTLNQKNTKEIIGITKIDSFLNFSKKTSGPYHSGKETTDNGLYGGYQDGRNYKSTKENTMDFINDNIIDVMDIQDVLPIMLQRFFKEISKDI